MSTTRREFLGIAAVSGLGVAAAPTRVATADPPKSGEPIIDPDLPIVDAHHHLWFLTEAYLARMETQDDVMTPGWVAVYRRHARYLLDEFLADVTTGHNVRATVFVECGAMYRATGPEAMQSVGEVEFANGIAAMAASEIFSKVKVCAGIVGSPNLSLGNAVEEVLRVHIQAGDVFDHLHRSSPAGMGTARDHAHARHLIEYLTAERRQPTICVLTTSADGVVEVVGHQHPPDA